eukprot:2138570-Rhodomonas_salina.2
MLHAARRPPTPLRGSGKKQNKTAERRPTGAVRARQHCGGPSRARFRGWGIRFRRGSSTAPQSCPSHTCCRTLGGCVVRTSGRRPPDKTASVPEVLI